MRMRDVTGSKAAIGERNVRYDGHVVGTRTGMQGESSMSRDHGMESG